MRNVLVCIAKNEDHYIDEWISYHLKLGFDNIFVYQNNWRYSGIFMNNQAVKFIEFDYDYPDTQGRSYNDFIQNYGGEYDFAAFFDIDEFFTLVHDDNISSFLSRYVNVDAIGINWRLFGDNGLSKVENEEYSVLKRFTRCGKRLNKHVKLILNLKRCKNNFIHNYCVHYTLKSTQTDSTINVARTSYIHGPFNENDLDECLNIAYLNHYRNKTEEENMRRAITDQTGIFYYNPYIKDFKQNFDRHNENEVEDLIAFNFFKSK